MSDINPSQNEAAQTPLMRQYWAAKRQHPDALLFFRMGDFYELFYEDAKVASRELQLTLTARDREKTQPMCGMPYHSVEGYITRLLRKGYRIAICEQLEDPKLTKKIVKRDVTRVLTPGTAIDPTLGSSENNYLAAVHTDGTTIGLAFLDLSTGDFRATEFTGAAAQQQAADELEKLGATEVLANPGSGLLDKSPELAAALSRSRTKTSVDDYAFSADYALPLLERQLGALSLEGFGLSQHRAAAVAAGVIVHYVRQTQQNDASHVDAIRYYERNQHMHLDQVTVRNLELLEPIFTDAGANATLFRSLDCLMTPMGKRLLRSSLLRPLLEPADIQHRYDAVAECRGDLIQREQIRRALGGILDLERLLARLSLDSAGPRDLLAMAASIRHLPELRADLALLNTHLWKSAHERLDTLEDLHQDIAGTLVPEPPLTLADGGVIATGIHAELDDLRAISHSGRSSIAAIEERERQRTGISSLKVRFNNVFGYYIEITKSNLANVPADYERKQTLVNAERFTTPELKEYETKVLTAHDRSIEIEKQIFGELRRRIMAGSGRIRKTSMIVAEIDLLASFAHLAAARGYTQPLLAETSVLEIVSGRHPVIECLMEEAGEGRFIPNNLYLDTDGPSLLLLTGPNMGGKSTYLRQAALLAIMAQIGSFVPAERMRYGIVDRVYTRIGASDNVARGRSTFMVEMMETATILNTATSQSLILLDEMGRGTSTYDGLALAWATVEHLHARVGARTLFATHYHELTILAEQLTKLKNLRVAVKESPQGIVFLHSIEDGPANKSYGIDVARLAGLPAPVIQRARQVLKQHERSERMQVAAEAEAPLQMTMFTPLSQHVIDRLEQTDVNSLTPLQALNLLEELKTEIKAGQSAR
ncbi:DNA mismatch repair protein MutS [Silvibacterium dinghuense]|uniref:DNA mismatch repair protein MutS n=1 Tax=Silvibacterium dinghuense TaxID=1560006 RepID=UPI0019A0366B|nr:DNA mismatch repair protein MutS [Silvibacterium dinghuense]